MRRTPRATTAGAPALAAAAAFSGPPAQPPRTTGHRRRIATIAAAAILAVVAMPLTAMASTGEAPKPKAPGITAGSNLPGTSYSGYAMYIAPSGGKGSPTVTGNGSSINGLSQTQICPGSCGALSHDFSTTYSINIGIITSCIQNMNGSGNGEWYGSSPYNADTMALDQNIWVSGVGVSISVGGSIGAGVSVNNNTIYFSQASSNSWKVSHSFTNARFCTKLGMTGPYENSVVAATFGSHTYRDFIN